ncbi:hypothetical protein PGTUg99_032276 [Puccinia graminis f. sp. tritici]|uniref:hAT-like transposase RNase-H fold domain-containing protein n=1 Tax=Puccinia graminis f. sp. tritici TaxID=56615 RepID=A0A5B0SDK3_PUCGR|nr:hypothetical protein PGTUg99_032276 [Puccinia graminis f. sp. tritici]
MSTEVDQLVLNKTGTSLDLLHNHISCFCHKLSLILNAGLKAIAEDPGSARDTNDPDADNQSVENDSVSVSSKSTNEEPETPATNNINAILKKADFVIQKITSSSSRRSEFDTWAQKLDYSGPGLIAGYGIRWNVKFKSQERAYNACKTSKIVKNAKEQIYFITKKMEGNVSLASMMLAEYLNIKEYLQKKLASLTKPVFTLMINKMIAKTNIYIKEALDCDAILLAATLNSAYRLSMIQQWFPSHHTKAQVLIDVAYGELKLELNSKEEKKEPTTTLATQDVNGSGRPVGSWVGFG